MVVDVPRLPITLPPDLTVMVPLAVTPPEFATLPSPVSPSVAPCAIVRVTGRVVVAVQSVGTTKSIVQAPTVRPVKE